MVVQMFYYSAWGSFISSKVLYYALPFMASRGSFKQLSGNLRTYKIR
jgi:hypothetical protein